MTEQLTTEPGVTGPASQVLVTDRSADGSGMVTCATATPTGSSPTGMVATTVLVAVSMTDTVPEKALVTNARVPAGLTATS